MELEKQKLEAEIRLAELRAQGGAAVNQPDPALDATSDVSKDWTHKDKDKDETLKDQDKDKD